MASTSQRDPVIDAVRGVCIVVMTLDHLPNNPLRPFTYEPFGYFTAAHIFVFLSGYVAAWRYNNLAAARPWDTVRSKLLRRTGVIWLSHAAIVAFLFLAGWSTLRAADGISGAYLFTQELFFVSHVDPVLPLYVCFLLALVLLLPALRGGSIGRVWMVSLGLWFASQVTSTSRFWFDPIAWQVVFVLGAWMGVRRSQGREFRVRPLVRNIGWTAAVAFFFMRHLASVDEHHGFGLAQSTVGVVRFLDLDFCILAAITLPVVWRQYLGRFLTGLRIPGLLGRNSLFVFVAHLIPCMWMAAHGLNWLDIRVVTVVLAWLGTMAAMAEGFRNLRRQRRIAFLPAGAGCPAGGPADTRGCIPSYEP